MVKALDALLVATKWSIGDGSEMVRPRGETWIGKVAGMANVVLGETGKAVNVASQVCVKTGIVTNERVTLRGSATPGWINLLLVFSVFGWLFATGMTQRRFVVTVPFTHAIHDRWQRLNWLAWGLGVGGVTITFWAAFTSADRVLLPLVRVHPTAASAIASAGAAMAPAA